MTVYCGPDIPHRLELADDAGEPLLVQVVLRPVDLRASHGFEVTLANLQEMARSYDPTGIEAAGLNFDHAWGGPSLGWCHSLALKGSDLIAVYGDLQPEAVEGIRSKRWQRFSSEFMLKHPITRGFYFTGLALLGTRAPAVRGLPLPRLTESRPAAQKLAARRSHLLIDLGAMQAPLTEDEMPDPTPTPAPQPPPATPPPPTPPTPAAQPTNEPAAAPAATDDEVRSELAAVREDRRQLAAERAAMRLERARSRVDRDLGTLGTRVTPGMQRAGLRDLLVHFAAQETPQTVTLSRPAAQQGQPTTQEIATYDVLLAVLGAMPELGALRTGELAAEDDPAAPTRADSRDHDTRRLHEQNGVDGERYGKLASKYKLD